MLFFNEDKWGLNKKKQIGSYYGVVSLNTSLSKQNFSLKY